jgi:hypothetical protein
VVRENLVEIGHLPQSSYAKVAERSEREDCRYSLPTIDVGVKPRRIRVICKTQGTNPYEKALKANKSRRERQNVLCVPVKRKIEGLEMAQIGSGG